jgi:GTP-binding protein HflX
VNFAPTPAARGQHWKEVEKVVLVGVSTREQDAVTTAQHLAELARLADSAGAVVVGEVVQHRQTFDPATLLGGGKVKELTELCEAQGVHKIIFDDDLSPGQAKRLEELTGRMILDRSGLILDIFARQARTREAKLQVEIAQLQYLIPRLTVEPIEETRTSAAAWDALKDWIDNNPLHGLGQRQTRDEMHERR